MPGAFGIRDKSAWHVWMLERFFDAEKDWPGCKEPFLHPHSFHERITPSFSRSMHDTQERAPIHRAAPSEMTRMGVEQSNLVGGDNDIARLIQPTSASATEHLQDFVRAEGLLDVIATIRSAGERNTTQ